MRYNIAKVYNPLKIEEVGELKWACPLCSHMKHLDSAESGIYSITIMLTKRRSL